MAPTKTDTGHGNLFDIFPERPQAIHGGARFDEGFNLQSKGAPKGASFDEFGVPSEPDNGEHGMLWDEWGWKDMPELHGGLLYDEGFASPAANASSRGPLYDLFQPSTQVKFIYDGKDSEGIVDHVDGEDVFVRQRGSANVVPVGLSQFLAFRSPSLDNTAVVAERSDAEAPSAWSPDAHGAEREGGEPYGQPIAPTPQGQAMQERSGVPEGSMNIVDQLKSMFDPNDIQKTKTPPVSVRPKTQMLPSELLKSCSEWSGVTSVAKEVTVAEAAIQAEEGAAPFSGSKGAGSYCPECRVNVKPSEDGRCPTCQMALKAHEGHKIVPREKGDGNGSAEDSAGKGVAEKSILDGLDVSKSGGYGMSLKDGFATHTFGGKKIGESRSLGGAKGGVAAYHKQGGAMNHIGTFPSHEVSHTAIRSMHEGIHASPAAAQRAWTSAAMKGTTKTSVLDDLRKAFGAGGDPMPGGQTNTLTGKPEQKDSNKGQAKSDPSGPMVPERAHAESDHNEDKSQPRTCPHCGEPLKELDDKTSEGAPSNVEPDVAHKCLEGLLDTFKTHEEPVSALDSLRGLVVA